MLEKFIAGIIFLHLPIVLVIVVLTLFNPDFAIGQKKEDYQTVLPLLKSKYSGEFL